MYWLMKARVRTSLQLQITFHSLLTSRCLLVRQKTEGDQLDQHPARTEVEGAEDADLDKEDRDAEVPTSEVNKTIGNPRRESTIIADTMWAKLPPTNQSMIRDQRKSFTPSKREVSAVNNVCNHVEVDSCYDGDDTETASEQFGCKVPRAFKRRRNLNDS